MKVTLTPTPLNDLVIVEIDHFRDDRGFFIESWNRRDFAAAGLNLDFVQDNHSRSRGNVVRGLHYQDMTAPIGKLVRCTAGKVFDVAVDLRAGSATYGKWFGIELSAENKKQLYVPVGFGHGFATLSEFAEVQYKQTGYYVPAAEGAILWNDSDIAIRWPVSNPLLSSRDRSAMTFAEYGKSPVFSEGY
jgi:dTDP-4-dehydrorhamnose 3,5-epimerase